MKQAFESTLNILLSDLLNQMGVTSHAEYLGQGRKDVLLYHQGLSIVLEGSYQKQDAEKDARKRIEQLAADVALAIYYPEVFSQSLTEPQIRQKLQTTPFSVRVIVPEDICGFRSNRPPSRCKSSSVSVKSATPCNAWWAAPSLSQFN